MLLGQAHTCLWACLFLLCPELGHFVERWVSVLDNSSYKKQSLERKWWFLLSFFWLFFCFVCLGFFVGRGKRLWNFQIANPKKTTVLPGSAGALSNANSFFRTSLHSVLGVLCFVGLGTTLLNISIPNFSWELTFYWLCLIAEQIGNILGVRIFQSIYRICQFVSGIWKSIPVTGA